jgi:hypothetical protein
MPGELERLAHRIAWLDRYRRPLAIALAALLTPLALWSVFGWLPANWPGPHLVAIAVTIVVIGWYAIETAFGFVLAIWETDYSKLTKPPTLPPARVVRKSLR